MKYQIESGADVQSNVGRAKDWAVLGLAIMGWILIIGLWMYWIKI